MNFELNDEQKLFGESVARLLSQHGDLEERRRLAKSDTGFNPAVWASLAELGVLALPFDEADGGFYSSGADLVPVMDAIGRTLALEPFLGVAILAGTALRHGTEAQKAERLPSLIDGSRLYALAHSEPDGRRHTLDQLRTTARRDGDGWRIDGAKTAILAGAIAAEWIVSARTPDGVALFLIPRETPGAEVEATRGYDGQPMADLVLKGVVVPGQALLGDERSGAMILSDVFERANAAVAAEAVGAMSDLVETTTAYLKTRRQFGAPISSFQALQHRVVDMMLRTELARSMALLAAVALDMEPEARATNIAAAKAYICDAARFVGEQAVQLHGAIGLTEELKVGHAFKRLTAITTAFGDADHHVQAVMDAGGLKPLSA